MKSRLSPRITHPLVASLAAVAVVGALAVPAAGAAPDVRAAVVPPGSVEIVDPGATPQTASLFQYLQDVGGEGILYGMEHTTSYGISIGTPDMTKSDVLGGVGDHPAIFAWDTLVIKGDERPGLPANTDAQNVELLAQYMEQAAALGGINTLSAHMENFVTGGSFYDLTGDTLRAVLPGGANNADLKAYLDNVALLANSVEDADGNLIPIIFRPWHENAGSWFWWGAAFGSPGEYAELYRFTVEYLRDVKGVHNLLYAFSPGGGFGGNADLYLRTYPGDEYIDVLGYDSYDNGQAGASWVNGILTDLAMIYDLAVARNKVPAFTEFGVSTAGLQPNGSNPNLQWYTDVLAAIKADPKASQIAYMGQWANFGLDNFHVPYPAYGTEPAHELLPDFQAYEEDSYTIFADQVTGAFNRTVPTVAHDPLVHLVSPADGARVAASPTTVRAKVNGITPTSVIFTVGALDIPLTLDADSMWWTGEWTIPPADLDNSTQPVSVTATDGVDTLVDHASIILGPAPVFPAGMVDDFEGYGDEISLRAAYTQVQSNVINLETTSVGEGTQAMRITYDVASQEYTGVGKAFAADWSAFGGLSLWIDPDASNNKMVLQLRAGGVTYEAYPSLAGDDPYEISIPWRDWRPAPWDTANAGRQVSAVDLQDVTQFFVYINSDPDNQTATAGSVVVDNIRATGEPLSFSDVLPGHPFYADIMWMLENGLTTGYADGTFRGLWSVNRDAMAAFLYRYVNGTTPAPDCTVAPFSDVPISHPFCGEIAWLADTGITTGFPDGTYRPATPVTREAMAAFLYRLHFGAGAEAADCTVTPFSDVAIAHPFCGEIAWLATTAPVPVSTGWPDGTFRPGLSIERQAMAAYLHRFDAVVLPDPSTRMLFDFEDGAQGWAPSNWEAGGSVAATGGTLQITSPAGGKNFGLDTPIGDLTSYSKIDVDLVSTSAGTDPILALKLGSSWLWCEAAATGWTTTPKTMVFDLTTMSAECQGMLNDVKGIYLWFHEGEQVIDNIVAN